MQKEGVKSENCFLLKMFNIINEVEFSLTNIKNLTMRIGNYFLRVLNEKILLILMIMEMLLMKNLENLPSLYCTFYYEIDDYHSCCHAPDSYLT